MFYLLKVTVSTGIFLWLCVTLVTADENGKGTQAVAETCPSASKLIADGIAALGGQKAISNIRTVTYLTPSVFRSQSLMENYSLLEPNTYVSIGGKQNVTFSYTSPHLQQRIDRLHYLSDFWYFGSPAEAPVNYTLVVQGGKNGYACYKEGNGFIFMDPKVAGGYVEAAMADFLIHKGEGMSPLVLDQIMRNNVATSSWVTLREGVILPSVYDSVLDLTIIFNTTSHLPYIIRSNEDHYIFGRSSNDLLVYNYTRTAGVLFPRRTKQIFNNYAQLEDTVVEEVIVNQEYPPDYFEGLSANEYTLAKAAPVNDPEYSRAELSEWNSNLLWGGKYTGTLANVSTTHPIKGLANVWYLKFKDALSYSQMIVEFEDAVIVGDAPPHQGPLVIEWVRQTLKKPITHLFPTHHHHDHTYGAHDFIKIGAKIITPEIAAPYWSLVPGAQLVTFNETHPYVHSDRDTQIRINWYADASHAEDQAWAMVTSPCPDADDPIGIFEADSWNPDFANPQFNHDWAMDFLYQISRSGVSKNVIVMPAHGTPRPLVNLLEKTGYAYPDFKTTHYKKGGPICIRN